MKAEIEILGKIPRYSTNFPRAKPNSYVSESNDKKNAANRKLLY